MITIFGLNLRPLLYVPFIRNKYSHSLQYSTFVQQDDLELNVKDFLDHQMYQEILRSFRDPLLIQISNKTWWYIDKRGYLRGSRADLKRWIPDYLQYGTG